MTNLVPEFVRINCCNCGAAIAWTKIIVDVQLTCNLCRLDEWATLKWLGIVNYLMPQTDTELDHENATNRKRHEASDRLDSRIREHGLLADPNYTIK